MATVKIRGIEYTIADVTDAMVRTISEHVNSTIPLAIRHQNTWTALQACLVPPLPEELFRAGVVRLNDTEIAPIVAAIANTLDQDRHFQNSLGGLKDLTGKVDAVTAAQLEGAIALLQPEIEDGYEPESTQSEESGVQSGLSAQELDTLKALLARIDE